MAGARSRFGIDDTIGDFRRGDQGHKPTGCCGTAAPLAERFGPTLTWTVGSVQQGESVSRQVGKPHQV